MITDWGFWGRGASRSMTTLRGGGGSLRIVFKNKIVINWILLRIKLNVLVYFLPEILISLRPGVTGGLGGSK